MKLLALRCPTCAQKLTPENPNVVVLRCLNCETAVTLDESGLEIINIEFATPGTGADKIDAWLPLWQFNGRVHIQSRQTQGGSRQAKKDAEQLWNYPRRLYVPAWDLSTDAACQLGGDLVQRQPVFQRTTSPTKTALVEAVLTPEDALKLLEFVVLNIEAARKDWLKDLQFTIEATSPQLWAVPGQKAGGSWRLAYA